MCCKALVWISRPLEEKDCNSISSMKELVSHLVSLLPYFYNSQVDEDCNSISSMKELAGTYIKEFVHGDLGRTTPSIGSILGCRAEIIQLDVTDVKMGDS
ncbi:unnamed protein product [Eruca vesicaria subsp. sativa]|uniref:tRNA pseudouridine(55) synthase n=1 Tax=Eruca vesicaria subsp. sativa TaxID=29727 RepID=A0ABC8M4C6_ERUVS|nr:unnamed protein product [Eruca vesicaria subsp. sativa]